MLARLKGLNKGDVGISAVTSMEIEYGLTLNPARARKIEPMIRALLQDLLIFSYRAARRNRDGGHSGGVNETGYANWTL